MKRNIQNLRGEGSKSPISAPGVRQRAAGTFYTLIIHLLDD